MDYAKVEHLSDAIGYCKIFKKVAKSRSPPFQASKHHDVCPHQFSPIVVSEEVLNKEFEEERAIQGRVCSQLECPRQQLAESWRQKGAQPNTVLFHILQTVTLYLAPMQYQKTP
jgi:hypothetical protein